MKLFAALVPYLAVLLGMYVLGSAWAAVLLYHAGIVVFLVWRRPAGLWGRIRSGGNLSLLIPGMLACTCAAPIIYFLWPWLGAEDLELTVWMAGFGLSGWQWVLLIPYFSLIHPLLEELHWRELAPEAVRGPHWLDFAFAGYHVLVLYQLLQWPWLILVFAVLSGSSLFWRWCAARFGGYVIPILTHAVADAAVLGGVLWLLS